MNTEETVVEETTPTEDFSLPNFNEAPSEINPQEPEEPAAPSADEQPDGTEPSPEVKQDEPFHKNPRWIKQREEIEALRAEIEELRQMRETQSASEEQIEIPEWFSELYGDDPNVWMKYQQAESIRIQEIKDQIRRDQEQELEMQRETEEKWTNWVSTQIEDLKEAGEKFDENALMKVIVDYSPTDEEGNLDFVKGLELLRKLEAAPSNVEAKKRVAALDNQGEIPTRDAYTSDDFKNSRW